MSSRTPLDPDTAREIDLLAGELAPLAARPEPRPEWTRELDARVAAGFPRRRRPRPRLSFGFLTPVLAPVAAVLILVVVLTNLSGGSPSTSSSGAGGSAGGGATGSSESARSTPSDAAPAPPSVAPTDAAPPTPSVAAGARRSEPSTGSAAPPPRRVERATQLYLGVRPARMQATAQRVIATTSDFDGVVLSSTVSSGDSANASFELSFPSDRVSQALARLARLGRVRSQTSTSRDVTRGFLTAREELDAARAERSGLLKALGNATTQTAIDALKRRVRLADDRVRAARAGVARIRNRTDFSKVSLQLSADRGATTTPPGKDGGWTPGDALHDAGRILAVSAGVALVVLACLVPLGVVLLLAGLGGRTLRRRRRDAALA